MPNNSVVSAESELNSSTGSSLVLGAANETLFQTIHKAGLFRDENAVQRKEGDGKLSVPYNVNVSGGKTYTVMNPVGYKFMCKEKGIKITTIDFAQPDAEEKLYQAIAAFFAITPKEAKYMIDGVGSPNGNLIKNKINNPKHIGVHYTGAKEPIGFNVPDDRMLNSDQLMCYFPIEIVNSTYPKLCNGMMYGRVHRGYHDKVNNTGEAYLKFTDDDTDDGIYGYCPEGE